MGAALLPGAAVAQACCAGAAAGQLGRLTLHEEALLGVDVRAVRTLGTFGKDGAYRASAVDAFQFEQSLLGTMRLGRSNQVGAVVPLVQSYARTPRDAGFGGGLGDLQLLGRHDFTFAGESLRIPGIALLGGVILPTGRPVEETEHPLGVEATGTGQTRAWAGLGIEQSVGIGFAQLMGSLLYDGPRTVGAREEEGRWGVNASFSLGASLPSELTLAVSAFHEHEPTLDRSRWRFGAAAGYPLLNWRLQGGVFLDAPFDGLARNQSAQTGLHFALMRTWI